MCVQLFQNLTGAKYLLAVWPYFMLLSCAIAIAFRDGNIDLLFCSQIRNICGTIKKFCKNSHGLQKINPTDSDELFLLRHQQTIFFYNSVN